MIADALRSVATVPWHRVAVDAGLLVLIGVFLAAAWRLRDTSRHVPPRPPGRERSTPRR